MRHLWAAACLVACGPVKGNPAIEDGPPGDGSPEVERELVVEARATPLRNVDVLFVIDDSNTMVQEQTTLANNFGSFIAALETIPDGLPDLHLGVITTDMGTKGSASPTAGPPIGQPGNGGCSNSGKAGVLQLGMATGVNGNFVTDIRLSDGTRQRNYDAPDLATVFKDMAKVGATGCGFEQPLHAMRAALDVNPSNAGFLRPDALLAVVFLTDEDDCSVTDPALFGTDPTLGPLTSFRCTRFGVTCAVGGQTPDAMTATGTKDQCAASTDATFLEPIQGFRDFLVSLKGDAARVVVGGIIGTPTPVIVGLDANNAPDLSPSCSNNVAGTVSEADPGVRMQSFFDLFPDRHVSTSICQNDFSETLEGTASLIAQLAGTACVGKKILDVDPAVGIQGDCLVEDTLGANVNVIQPCEATNGEPTCWRLVSDPIRCPLFDQLRLEVVRTGAVDPATITRARCRVQS